MDMDINIDRYINQSENFIKSYQETKGLSLCAEVVKHADNSGHPDLCQSALLPMPSCVVCPQRTAVLGVIYSFPLSYCWSNCWLELFGIRVA